jgi:hypothetical protein
VFRRTSETDRIVNRAADIEVVTGSLEVRENGKLT